jgi:tryptophan 2,3-dioxygenase
MSHQLTYGEYLKVQELLRLQKPLSDPQEHDEMLFIIIHQTYELWFKQILHELEKLQRSTSAGQTWGAVKTMRRVLTILKTLVSQVDILETMTPLEFNSFRGYLQQASGFQSVQFRELEMICGLRSGHVMKALTGNEEELNRLQKRMDAPTLWESFIGFMRAKGYETLLPKRIQRDGLIYDPCEETQEILLKLFREDPESANLAELFVDFDEGLMEWRYRHVKMVERTIGTKRGTGGSDGSKYLHSTLNQPIFPDLWMIRSRF